MLYINATNCISCQARVTLGGAHTSTRLYGLPFASHCWTGSRSGREPKSNWLVLVTEPTTSPNFVTTRPQLFEISCYISFLIPSLNVEESLFFCFFFISNVEARMRVKTQNVQQGEQEKRTITLSALLPSYLMNKIHLSDPAVLAAEVFALDRVLPL